ncbi:hypothetical protein GGI04_001440 [Coemansia thaxteri]|uniref:F-box domain-containing protein n=1 Tax=Coemansia thaxteri TaxID=2663907 RepID=A0A9W8BH62_9FUNG|nr:hypothetical protein H4R26_001101 [Coemansia thaxteri]KAJ2007653.1 hypothetical protein GGI04_001440 [Coemansia thaxteri]KAJ2471249.1 hypothetical protein GGI02_002394 [Coemansia sp. RSA 2322]KAJ2484664.1 hypothetical protein EV174_002251 [Coemansia sp. RSA 2320]
MDAREPEEVYCTCSALASHLGEHTPTCMLYTPISASDAPESSGRLSAASGSVGRGGSGRPPSYPGYGMGVLSGSNAYSYHYPAPSNVSSVAASYASTYSIMDSAAATETESHASYSLKRSASVCSFSSTASSYHMLPTELFRLIFLYLGADDLKAVVQVSRQWRSAGNPLLWRTMAFPLDKRRLATMKQALSRFGHHVRRVIITPPILEIQHSSHDGSSRRVSMSNTRSRSLSRPLSRSGSVSLHQQQHQQHLESLNELNDSGLAPSADAAANGFSGLYSGFTSSASSPRQYPLPLGLIPPPSPLTLSSPRQRTGSSASTPLADLLTMAAPSLSGGAGERRASRASVLTSPSPLLPPVYAVPIPGTPGPGNVLSESLSHSALGSSWGGAGGLGTMNISGVGNGANFTRPTNAPSHSSSISQSNAYLYHEVSEGTVLRMHQYMEQFCPNVLEAIIKNPTGISSHGRRLGILTRLFQMYPRLERLDLSDFIMWDTQPLQMVSEQLQNLTSLDVTNRVELSDADLLPVVESCPRLRELRIRATNATDATVHAIVSNLSHLLVSLNVGGCPVSSAAMAELVTRCTRLRILQMWSCLRLDDMFLLALDPRVLTELQVLDLMDVQKFSVEAVRQTFGQKSWPYLKYLRIRAKCTSDEFSGIPARAVLKLNSTTILD